MMVSFEIFAVRIDIGLSRLFGTRDSSETFFKNIIESFEPVSIVRHTGMDSIEPFREIELIFGDSSLM